MRVDEFMINEKATYECVLWISIRSTAVDCSLPEVATKGLGRLRLAGIRSRGLGGCLIFGPWRLVATAIK